MCVLVSRHDASKKASVGLKTELPKKKPGMLPAVSDGEYYILSSVG